MKKKRQHIVPQSYLRAFVDPTTPPGHEPYVWVYEGERGSPYARAPRKTAVKSHYYTFTPANGSREPAVEDMLEKIESVGLPVLKDLAVGRDPSDLTQDERAGFSLFVGMLELRVPRWRDSIEKVAEDVMKHALQIAAAHPEYFERTVKKALAATGETATKDIESVRQFALSGDYDVDIDPLHSLQMMVKMAPTVAEYVFDCRWRVLEAPEGHAFFTSDAPLVKVSTVRLPPPWCWGTGWATPWMEATLPLTPRACLLISLHHPEGRELIHAQVVREVNWRTATFAYQEVYSSRQLDSTQLNRPATWDWWKPVTDTLAEPAGGVEQ